MLGLGTAALGRPQYINIRKDKTSHPTLEKFKQESFKVLEKAYQLGVRYFDTAPGYGLAEDLLLQWLQTKNDPSLQIATKWGYTYVANFDANAKVHEVKEHSIEKLKEQWQVSQAFLPHLKIYQIHSATLETGVLNNTKVLQQLAFLKKEHGLQIGITTTGSNQLEVLKKAVDVSVAGEQLFNSFQITYNILDQSLETMANTLIRQDKKVIIKEAVANGRMFRNNNYNHYSKLYHTLETLAAKHQVGLDAIALKFCQQNIKNSMVLSGASTIEQLQSNLQAAKITLSEEEINLLKSFKTSPNFYWQERKELAWN
ncbi:aldo/keto reductase [Lacinutrix sp. C3R15]|uniref:aldo/keto reductase n=1 Tax=Flavobacteriaceae TaxID=49546 RepID=UPI001C0A2B3A|nr:MULTISPECIES: aldo/keto reductase [Flavobacteriaceae]MBU2940562.1 aldo/keto reductase [Lacinutrix sp. C3R15]MDO6623881.1 aldo/keto reductase [Oceanihabitans sp. 1_MG-2023]